MTTNSTFPATSEFDSLIHAAVTAFQTGGNRPSAAALAEALWQAEKVTRQQRITYPFSALWGTWRLYFIVNKPRKGSKTLVGKGLYIPGLISAKIEFQGETADHGTLRNQLQVGLLSIALTGLTNYPSQKNLLAFDFSQMELQLLNRTLYRQSIRQGKAGELEFAQKAIAQLPFFAFFYVSETCIAARGRGGGVALWVKSVE